MATQTTTIEPFNLNGLNTINPPNLTTTTSNDGFIFNLNSKLIQYLYMDLVCIIGLCLSLHLNLTSRKEMSNLSPQLRIHQFAWVFFMFITILYTTPIIWYWSAPVGEDYSYYLLLLRGAFNQTCVTISALPTTFVTLDRIISILVPQMGRSAYPMRLTLKWISLMLLGGMFWIVIVVCVQRSWMWNKTRTTCLTFGCILYTNIYDLAAFKVAVGLFNISTGIIFIYLYISFGQRTANTHRDKRKNYLILMILINEVIFNLLPASLYYIYSDSASSMTNSVLAPNTLLGPAHCSDGFIMTLLYWRIWTKRFRKQQTTVVVEVGGHIGTINNQSNSMTR